MKSHDLRGAATDAPEVPIDIADWFPPPNLTTSADSSPVELGSATGGDAWSAA